MPGFGFGLARSPRRFSSGITEAPPTGTSSTHTFGALSRNQPSAGIPIAGSAIVSGDAAQHWEIGSGRLFPSAGGDAADLNAGPYNILLDNGDALTINIEPDTWDVSDQSEWDFVAKQSPSILAGKKIALRNASTLNLGITGSFATPLRRADLRNADGQPLVIEGRFGDPEQWDDYCEIDKVEKARGMRGVTFRHLKTTAVAEQKFNFVAENATNHTDEIIIEDCYIRGATGDPNGDYSTSSNYPNLNKDLISTTGSATGHTGNITVRNCRIEWGDSLVNIKVDRAGSEAVITDNSYAFFYGDAIAVTIAPAAPLPCTISGNFIHSSVGQATDSANPHVDAIRLQGGVTAAADWGQISIENNIILQGNSRGDMQGIFLDDMRTQASDSGHYFTALIRNNLVVLNHSVHGITVIQAKDCSVENNTVVSFDRTSQVPPSVLIAATGLSTATNGGGNSITNCIADKIGDSSGNLSVSGNHEAGKNGELVDYATLFDGPNWNPTDTEQAKLSFNPKVAAGANLT